MGFSFRMFLLDQDDGLYRLPNTKFEQMIRNPTSYRLLRFAGARCQCGAPIWIIGSAQTGLGCFACITGQSDPDQDYEIDVADEGTAS